MSGAPYIGGQQYQEDAWSLCASGAFLHPGNMYGSPCLSTYDSLAAFYEGYEPTHQLGYMVGMTPNVGATGPVMPPAQFHLSQQGAAKKCMSCSGARASTASHKGMW